MSKKLKYADYKSLIEKQSQRILDALATAATGQLDEINIEISDDDQPLAELTYGINFLLEDLRHLLAEQERLRVKLEDSVTLRTKELEDALAESDLNQKRFISQEWSTYVQSLDNKVDADSEIGEALAPVVNQAVLDRSLSVAKSRSKESGAALAIPIQYAEETIGFLGFEADEVDSWDEGDLAAVEDIVEQVGLALENQRLFDQTQIALAETELQAARLARLNQMGAELNTAIDMQDVYTIATTYIRELLKTDIVSITILSDDFQYFHVYANQGDEGVNRTGETWGLEDTVIGEAVYQRSVLYHPDISKTDFADHKQLLTQGAKSTLIAPLVAQKVIGTVNAASLVSDGFNSQDENLLLQIASLLAATVENRELLDQTAQRAAQLGKLSKLESALSRVQNEDGIVEAFGQAFPEFPGYIRLFHVETDYNDRPTFIREISTWHENALIPKDAESIQRQPVSKNETWIIDPPAVVWVEDVDTDERLNDKQKLTLKNQQISSYAALPGRSAGSWQSLVVFAHTEPFSFENDFRFVLENLLDTLAAIVASQRSATAQELAYQESVRRSQELDALNQVGRVVVQQLDERQLSDAIFEQIDKVLDFDVFFVGIYKQAENEFNTLMFSDKSQQLYNLPARKLTAQNGTYQAITKRQTILVQPNMEEFAELPAPDPSQLIGNRTAIAPSRVYVPLTSGRNVIGALSIHSNRFQAYSESQINLLNGIATYFAVAWQNANLFQETTRRAEDLSTINKIAQNISGQLDEEQIYEAVFGILKETIDFDVALFGLYDENVNVLDFRYEYFDKRIPNTKIPLTPNTFSYDVIKQAKAQLIHLSDDFIDNLTEDNLPDNVIDKKMKADQPSSMIYVPLVSGNKTIGVMSIQSRKRQYYTQDTMNLLQGIASYATVAVQNSQLFMQTERRADQERLVNEITQKIQNTTSIEKALQTTVQELGRALKSHYAQISLSTSNQTTDDNGSGAS